MKRLITIILISLLLFISWSAKAEEKNNDNFGFFYLLQEELTEEISPYTYLRMEFYRDIAHRSDFEATKIHQEMEDDLIDDVQDAFEDVGENILKKTAQNFDLDNKLKGIGNNLKISIYRQKPTVEEDRYLTLDAGMNIKREEDKPLNIGLRFRSLNDGPGMYLKWKQLFGANGELNKHDLAVFPAGEEIHYRVSSLFGWPGIKAEYNWKKEKLKIKIKDLTVGEDKYISCRAVHDFKQNNFGFLIQFYGKF